MKWIYSLLFASLAQAATYPVTPANIAATMVANGAGNTYTLGDGTYEGIYISTSWIANESSPTIIQAEHEHLALIRPSVYECGIQFKRGTAPQWIEIVGLDIGGAVMNGVQFNDGSHITVRNCLVHGNGYQGLAIWEVDHLRVEGCRLYANGSEPNGLLKHGAYLSGTHLTVVDCVAYGNTGGGIHLGMWARSCIAARNVCYGNAGSGLMVQSYYTATDRAVPSQGTWLANNTCVNNTLEGLHVSWGAWDVLRGNVARNNADYDIDFYYAVRTRVLMKDNSYGDITGNGSLVVEE